MRQDPPSLDAGLASFSSLGLKVGRDLISKGVHEAARIAALAAGGEILASRETVAGTRYHASTPRTLSLKGIAEPVEVVTVQWR